MSKQPSGGKARDHQDHGLFARIFSVPHTVTFLGIGLCLLAYFSHPLNPPERPTEPNAARLITNENTKAGIWALVCVFLGYSLVQGPTTCMVRPHPSFWKLVHGIMICYLLFWVWMLFQNVDDARQFLRNMYPELGVELPERSYGSDCALLLPPNNRINWEAIKSTVFDEFVVAHTLGWWGKALIIRDRGLLWIISIAFELMELTFQHLLPNFNECWWDSWILDVAMCNAIGIEVGMWTVRFFRSKEYNWSGISSGGQGIWSKLRRCMMQFTPYSWDDFQWQIASSPKRCLQCLFPIVIILLFEVNHFFLKFELWVPPRNPLNTIRLTILFLMALPAMKEYYEFIEKGERDIFFKLGTFAWLGMAIAFVETLTVIKFGHGMFPQPWPTSVLLAWGGAIAGFAIFISIWSVLHFNKMRMSRRMTSKSD